MAHAFEPTHIPYGLTDPAKRTIRNPYIKDEATWLQFGIETAGQYAHSRLLVKPGGGPPMHNHKNYSESFYPVHGVLQLQGAGSKVVTLENGATYTGIEKMLCIYYGLSEIGAADELYNLLFLSHMADMGFPGIGGWLMGLVAGVVGWHAKLTGVEENLTRKYYGRPITEEELKEWREKGSVSVKKEI